MLNLKLGFAQSCWRIRSKSKNLLKVLDSRTEYHFVHRALPHVRSKRSVPHTRRLKVDPLVSWYLQRQGRAYAIIISVEKKNGSYQNANTADWQSDCQSYLFFHSESKIGWVSYATWGHESASRNSFLYNTWDINFIKDILSFL